MMLLFGFLGLILFGGILVAVLVGGGALARHQGSGIGLSGQRREPTARDTLDERLARGEISREEHEAIRQQIES
ncbi:MAG: SHOCT domain-containing protein [Anaerolineae bacterium]